MSDNTRALGATTTLGRLEAMKRVLLQLSSMMGTTSPELVLSNFIGMLQHASPRLKVAIMLITPWAMLVTAIRKYALISQTLRSSKDYLTIYLHASVSIPSSHPLHKQILAYMVEDGLGSNARTLAVARPAEKFKKLGYASYYDMIDDSIGSHRRNKQKRNINPEDEEAERNTLSFVPEVGKYAFWWKWHRMTFERRDTTYRQLDNKGRLNPLQRSSENETIVISCVSLFAGAKPIQDFLNHIRNAPAKENMTTIYRPDGVNWDQGITRPGRELNAVTLDSNVKDELVKDIATYLSPATRKYYASRGIPWRRGLLFYGPPGCGKTSFTTAIAGHFKLNVYMISLSTNRLNDAALESLFEQLPSKCIVLLEDIDSAGIRRQNMKAEEEKRRKKEAKQRVRQDRDGQPWVHLQDSNLGGVTMSGFLNVLDGIQSKEGMVTIMTSNSPDSLDPALIRPGRIDRKVLFGYASKEVIAKLFSHIFEKAPEELAEGEAIFKSDHDISALAEEFANKVPAEQLTPAEVQGYLLVHRDDPVIAVEEAETWVKKTLRTKAAGTNVEAFAGEERLRPGGSMATQIAKQAKLLRIGLIPDDDDSLDDDVDEDTVEMDNIDYTDEASTGPPYQGIDFADFMTSGLSDWQKEKVNGLSDREKENMMKFALQTPAEALAKARQPMAGTVMPPTPPMSREASQGALHDDPVLRDFGVRVKPVKMKKGSAGQK